MALPLERFTVIDLTRARSGPTAVRQLADMGASVIKVEAREEIEGDSTRLGFDFEALSAVNPRLVYGSISGFGQTGLSAGRPGYDQIAQGMGGLMSITGLPGQGPVRVGIPVADLTAGLYLAQGILVALLERETSGRGQWVKS